MHALSSNGEDNGFDHVLEGTLTLDQRTDVIAAHFKESPPHSSLDWHDAPVSQYVITLTGTLEFATRDDVSSSGPATCWSQRTRPAPATSGA